MGLKTQTDFECHPLAGIEREKYQHAKSSKYEKVMFLRILRHLDESKKKRDLVPSYADGHPGRERRVEAVTPNIHNVGGFGQMTASEAVFFMCKIEIITSASSNCSEERKIF